WLWRDGRAREHYLAHLSTINPEADRRRLRRALTPEEAARLIDAAERGPVVMGMTGPDRARLYSCERHFDRASPGRLGWDAPGSQPTSWPVACRSTADLCPDCLSVRSGLRAHASSADAPRRRRRASLRR